MLVANVDVANGLANGATGVVTLFHPTKGCPIVKFYNSTEAEIDRHKFRFEDPASSIGEEDEGQGGPKRKKFKGADSVPHAVYEQVPLRVAYAISIHKSQGQTIPHLRIDAERIFEYGQFYVALSRAPTLDAIQLSGFHPSVIKTHPEVVKFYDRLMADNHKFTDRIASAASPEQQAQEMSKLVGEMCDARVKKYSKG